MHLKLRILTGLAILFWSIFLNAQSSVFTTIDLKGIINSEGITTDVFWTESGKLIVSDNGLSVIHFLDNSGVLKEKLDLKPSSIQPQLLLSIDDQSLFVYDDKNNQSYIGEANLRRVAPEAFEDKNIRNLTDGIISKEGFLYILDKQDKSIKIFTTEGIYISSIFSRSYKIEEPVALYAGPGNSIYLLDESNSSLINIDQNGGILSNPIKLVNAGGGMVKDAQDFVVLQNGKVLLVDKKGFLYYYNKQMQFERLAQIGKESKEGYRLAIADNLDGDIAILNRSGKMLYLGKAGSKPITLESALKIKFGISNENHEKIAFGYTALNGTKIFSPISSKRTIIGKDREGNKLFQNNNVVEEIMAIDGTDEFVFVLDKKKKLISKFDLRGNLLHQFGKEKPSIKDPTGMVVLSNGRIIVADKDHSGFLVYDLNGNYQDKLVFREIPNPLAIVKSSKSEVYAWEGSKNTIFAIDPVSRRIGKDFIQLRGRDISSSPGKITNMTIDPLDQLIIFNETNQEFDLYQWDKTPVPVAHFRNPQIDGKAFMDVESIFLDASDYTLHVDFKKGNPSVFQFSATPPKPENLYRFEAKREDLLVYYKPLSSPYVNSYGLILKNGQEPENNTPIFSTPEGQPFILNESFASEDLSKPIRYALVSMNPGAVSKATAGFDNFFGWGVRAFKKKDFEKAALAFQKALKYMGRHETMVRTISDYFLAMGQERISEFNAYEGLDYLRSAYYLAPASKQCAEALAQGYKTVFWKLASQNNFRDIVSMTEEEVDDPYLQQTLLATIDSIGTVFSRLPNYSSLQNAKLLREKLVDWQPDNPKYQLGLGEVSISLFERMRKSGMPYLELNILSFEAEQSLKKALELYKNNRGKRLHALNAYLNILEKRGKFNEMQSTCENTLTKENNTLSENEKNRLRLYLARAYVGQDDFLQGIAQYEYLIGNNPTDKNLQRSLADVYLRNGNTQDAKAIYQRLLVEDRDNAILTGNIGLIELAENNYIEASYQLERALNLDPTNLSFRGPLGEAFENAGNISKAIENYAIAINYFRQNKNIRNDRSLEFATPISNVDQLELYLLKQADLYQKTGKYNLAIQGYEELLTIDEGSANAWYGLGKANLSAGLVYDAMKSFFEAKTLDTGNASYESAYQDALKLRDRVSRNEEPLKLSNVEVTEIFPSLYQNYGIANKLPIGKTTISNNTGEPINSASLSVFIPGLMNTASSQELGILLAYSNTTIPLSAVFSDKILQSTETKTYQIKVTLSYVFKGRKRSIDKTVPVTIYGRNQISWSDKRKLASFITPNVSLFIDFSRKLDRELIDELSYEIPGNLNKALQIYSVLNNAGINYAPDPNQGYAVTSSNSELLDFLQYPAETLSRKSGDCDDLVTLFSSLLENAGVPTGYIDIPGHVFLAINLQITSENLLYTGIPSDMVILHLGEAWIPLETTLVGEVTFEEAWKKGAAQYRETINKNQFPELISVADARDIYNPSNYIPSQFKDMPAITPDVKNEYSEQLSRVMVLTNEGLLREMENQYKNEPSNIFVKNKYGILLAKTGKLEEAKNVFIEGYQLVPSNPSILNNLGNVAFSEKKYDKALDYYLKAVNYDNSDVQIMINVSKTYFALGRLSEAKEWFGKASNIDKNVPLYFTEYKNQLK